MMCSLLISALLVSSVVASSRVAPKQKAQLGGYTLSVPSNIGSPVWVNTANCNAHCPPDVFFQPRRCLRTSDDIPRWGPPWRDADVAPAGNVYESYACLVCINAVAMMARSDHPEFGNDERETQDLINAVWGVSAEAGIPPQIPLSILLQESLGSVRPHNGDGGLSRGPFQIQSPVVTTCKDTQIGSCPTSHIQQMAREGICGPTGTCASPQAPGIAFYFEKYSGNIGSVARAYNSGSVYDEHDLTVVTTGTPSYASDIAMRAMGIVKAGFFSRTCCARCTEDRTVLEVRTCGEVDGALSDFCGDARYSYDGHVD